MRKIPNEGDIFVAWCEKNNRMAPPQELVDIMNNDMEQGKQAIRNYKESPRLYRNLQTYLAGKGR